MMISMVDRILILQYSRSPYHTVVIIDIFSLYWHQERGEDF